MELTELKSQLLVLQSVKDKAFRELDYDLAASTRDKIKILSQLIKRTKIMNEDVYILGMAKSSLKFNTSGPRRNLELDVLRLIHFVNLYADQKIKVFAFMLVHNEDIRRLIFEKWFVKYKFTNIDYFNIITFENDVYFLNNKVDILIEKKNNSTFNNSVAVLSEKVVEKILNSEIEKYFYTNDFHEIELKEFCGISWDFVKLFKVQ